MKPQFSEHNTTGRQPRLTLAERIEIHAGVYANKPLRSIGRRLGRSASTIKRELGANLRNRYDRRQSGYRRKDAFGTRQSGNAAVVRYNAVSAQWTAEQRVRRPKLTKLAGDDRLRAQVQTRLELRHSPIQIATRLRRDFADYPEMWVSHEAIYQAI